MSKTLRLIELFAGYGSQAMALKRLEIPFEHYRVIEFDKYAIKSYNAMAIFRNIFLGGSEDVKTQMDIFDFLE